MTLQEVCLILGKSEITITRAFNRTKKNLAKKGTILTKEGRGLKAVYNILYKEDFENEKMDNLLSCK